MWIHLKACLLAFTLKIACEARRVIETAECYDKVSDVVFLLDSSVSLREEDYTSQIQFVQRLVGTFPIGTRDVKVGVVTFGTDIRLDFHLDTHLSQKELKSAVSRLTYLTGRQGTDTGAALEYARSEMFKTKHGGRKDSKKIIILITDGYSNNITGTLWEATMAHSYDIEVFAIGVGRGTDDKELLGIGSSPLKQHVFKVNSYEALPSIQKSLEHMVCERPSGDQHKPTENEVKSNCGGKPADVYFIVDSSSSIWKPDFYKQLDFIKDVTRFFDLGEDRTRVGVVTFSDGIHPTIPLSGSYQRTELEDMIDKVPYTAGGTNTGGALRYLTDHAFSRSVARPGVAHVAILMTDGQSRNLTMTSIESRRAHKAGVYLFAIGIGHETDRGELQDIANDPNDNFMFMVDDYKALNSIKDLLAIKTCQVSEGFMKDEAKTCQFTKETDVMFLFDAGAMGRQHTRTVEHAIGDLVRDMDRDHVTRAGILRESCPRGTDVSLSQFVDAYSFKRHLKNLEYRGLQPLIHRLRRYSFKLQYGGRKSSDKFAVVFVDDKLDNAKATILEARRAKFVKIKIFAVAIGKHYDEKELQLLASVPSSRHILHVPSYKNLADIKGRLLSSMCGER